MPPRGFASLNPGYISCHERRHELDRFLSRARAQIPAVDLRRPDRPGRDGAHDLECVRERPHPAGLGADRRARRRQDHDGAHPGARAELRAAGRLDHRPDHRHAGARRALPGDHGEPASRRDRDGCGFPQRRRGRARDQRGDPLRAGLGPLQGLHPRRSAHALRRRLQCAAQDFGRAAGARQVRVRDHRNPQSPDHRVVALPALRPAPHRCGAAGQASARHCREGNHHRRAGSFRPDRARRGRLGARCAVAARPGDRTRRRDRCAPRTCGRCSGLPTAPRSSICSRR